MTDTVGRFQFDKLPFGITCAPELFQRRMSQILSGLEGVLCLIDDVLVFGRSAEEHAANVTLNADKCSFQRSSIQFLGHIVDSHGISADPRKTEAIRAMPPPSNTTELKRFLGMANQLGKFTSKLAELSQPLRELLSSKNAWVYIVFGDILTKCTHVCWIRHLS